MNCGAHNVASCSTLLYCLCSSLRVTDQFSQYVVSGFRRDVDEIRALLGYYAAMSGSPVPTFRDNLSVPSKSKKTS
jgi:hypothetical protein